MTTAVMTGRERVKNAICRKPVDRTPWVPFVGCHAGALINMKADHFLQSEDALVKGVQTAIDRYQPDGICVAFDLQIEAEVLGCELAWAPENPPAVTSHPLSNGGAERLNEMTIPQPDMGRIKTVLDAARRLRTQNPDTALYGLVTGPFTLALHLLGTDIFMKLFEDPDYVKELMTFGQKVTVAMSEYYIDAGCDVIAVVDPMTSQIGPDQFREFVRPYLTDIFDAIHQKDALGSLFVCGHAEQNIPEMCQCNCDNISIDENIPLEYVRDICAKYGISLGGNLQLTTVLLLGTPEDVQKNAVACLEIAGEEGFVLAPGCDLPYATPPENLEAIIQVVQDPYQRDVIKSLSQESKDEVRLDMKDYGQYGTVVVDIITLDSEACAPCQYMVDAVKRVAPEFEGIVEWREHKIKYRESLVFMTSLMVRNVPTICIDGQIKFVSRIPPKEDLITAIQDRINEKYRMKIKRKKASLYILGPESDETEKLEENMNTAFTELGLEPDIRRITDEQVMFSYGVAPVQAPAVVMAKYQLKSTKTIPSVEIIKEWLKDAR